MHYTCNVKTCRNREFEELFSPDYSVLALFSGRTDKSVNSQYILYTY